MNKLKISVSLCTYNGARFLSDQLESIASQNRLPDELIICDDKSTDKTVEIIESFIPKAPFKTSLIINKRNLGSTKNFEKAIKLCKGDIIFLSDQDDLWFPTKISQMEDVFLNYHDIGAVFSNAEIIDDNSNPLGFSLWDKIKFDKKMQHQIIKNETVNVLLKQNVVTGATLAIRSDLIKTVLPVPPNWIHDHWIALFTAVQSKLYFIDAPLIKYRSHSSQHIGINRKKTFAKIKLLNKHNDIELFNSLISLNNEALEHLHNTFPKSITQKYNPIFDTKLSHLKIRREISYKKTQSFLIIFKEFSNGNYRRFSNNFPSIIYDIFRLFSFKKKLI